MASPPSRRNYRKEYDSFHAKPEQKKNRAARNKANATAKRRGASVGGKSTGNEVGHVKSLKSGGSRSTSNTRVQSVKSNRSHGGKISSGTKGKTFTKRKR